jgi:hypothetical protein
MADLFVRVHVIGAVLVMAGLFHRFQRIDVGLGLSGGVMPFFNDKGHDPAHEKDENEDKAIKNFFVHGFM